MKAIGQVWTRLPLVALLLVIASSTVLRADEDKALREKALQLNEITGDDPITGMIVTLLEDKPTAKKLLAVAYKMSKDAPKDKPVFNINGTYILGRTAQVLKEAEISEHFLRQNSALALKLYSSKKFVTAYRHLVELLYDNKRYAEVEKLCKEILELDGDRELERFKFTALETLIKSLSKQGKSDQALLMVDNLIKNAKRVGDEIREVLLGQVKGGVLREAGKNDEAAKLYEELIERIYKVEDLKGKKEAQDDFADTLRYILSGVYIDLKKVDKAAEHLKTLLAKDEKNPTYNNDLGYIWADHGMNLDEAEKLIRRAIEEDRRIRKKIGAQGDDDRDNAAYLDSLGWVLFKKKKYKDAREQLEAAIKQEEGQHLEIYDHLAEVLLALGEKDKAIETWKKGLTCKPVSKRDDQRKIEVEKKLKQHEKK